MRVAAQFSAAGRRLLASAACALLLAAAGPAAAGPPHRNPVMEPDPFTALVGKRRPREAAPARAAQEVERYVVSADGRSFLFENLGGEGRIKFLCREGDPRLDCRIDPEGPAEEIFVVTGVRGPRGDLIFKDHDGETRLRIASYGGATVFWPGEEGRGQAASKSFGEDAGALDLAPASLAAAARRAQSAAAHLSALTGSPILFDLGSPTGGPRALAATADDAASEQEEEPPRFGASVLADAVARVAGGMRRVASDPTGARVLGARISRVRFVPGPAPALSLDGETLTIVYNPEGGLAGRPSSAAVAQFLENTL